MSVLSFLRRKETPGATGAGSGDLEASSSGYSIEVMPRTAEKVEDFRALLPAGTRVYIAHIEGTPIEDMVATAARLRAEGFEPMPHFPARIIKDAATLAQWVSRYQDAAGVTQGLILAGGVKEPVGEFDSSIQLLGSGVFDRAGFTRLHVAGHPEGNRDIDPDGSDRMVVRRAALEAGLLPSAPTPRWRSRPSSPSTPARSSPGPNGWRPRASPADPHRHRRPGQAADADQVRHRLRRRPVAEGAAEARDGRDQAACCPTSRPRCWRDLAAHKAAHPEFGIEQVHFFPLGGIKTCATWVTRTAAPRACRLPPRRDAPPAHCSSTSTARCSTPTRSTRRCFAICWRRAGSRWTATTT